MYDISIMILSAYWCSKMLFPVLCTIGDVRTCYLSRTAQVNQKHWCEVKHSTAHPLIYPANPDTYNNRISN